MNGRNYHQRLAVAEDTVNVLEYRIKRMRRTMMWTIFGTVGQIGVAFFFLELANHYNIPGATRTPASVGWSAFAFGVTVLIIAFSMTWICIRFRQLDHLDIERFEASIARDRILLERTFD
jgi:hypothetical protein